MSGRPEVRVILHGKHADDERIREAVDSLRSAERDVDVRVTWEAGDSRRFATAAVLDGVETVVAAGGDGTVREVIQGVLDGESDRGTGTEPAGRREPAVPSLPSIGIVPLGTANDFATAAGIPVEPDRALELIVHESARPVDLGTVGGRCFLNMATGGFGSQATTSTPEELKAILGGAAYLLTGLARMTSIEAVEASVRSADFEWEGELLMLAVGNGRMAGGGHLLCPNAVVDDGLFDVTILPGTESGAFGGVVSTLLAGGLSALDTRFEQHRASWVEVEAYGGLHVNLDGEPVSSEKLRFEVLPRHVRLHLPHDSPILGAATEN